MTTKWFDPVIAGLITGVIALLGSMLGAYLGFYTIFIAMGAGYLALLATKKAIKNRRSPLLKFVMAGTAFAASLAPTVYYLYAFYWLPGFGLAAGLYTAIWRLAFSVIIASYIYYQLRN